MQGSLSHSEVRTFLIADVRGYTRFTLERGDVAAAELAARFADLTEEVVAAFEGQVIELRGDEALAVFTSSRLALRAAVELQRRFVEESSESVPLKVGIGLDAGEAVPVKGGYRGASLNLAARLCNLAGAGEVLASDTVASIARKLDGLEYTDRGPIELKGFADPVRVVQVLPESDQRLGLAETAGPDGGAGGQRFPIGGFLGALPANPLVGRDQEVTQIAHVIGSVAGGEGRLLLLAGEPGAGKTRLAQEATLELRDRGFLIAAGSSFESRQNVPYYPFLDALTTLYGAVSSRLRFQIGGRWPSIGRLLPEAGIPLPIGADGPEEQERLVRAVVSVVQAAADEEPIAILLDDLHWADEASLDLLQQLARHTRGNRVLLLGTYRDAEVHRHHPLERTLRDLHRAGVMERIAVRRLGQEGTRALMAASLDEDVSETFAGFVHRQTEGNPFFTHEILHALIERGAVYRQNGYWELREIDEIEVPESVRSVIGERLSHLQERTLEFLGEASVFGQNFRFEELQALGPHPEEEVEEALGEATQSGIIQETVRDHYGFNHALTQSALYAELSARRKRRLHRKAGEALEGLPEHRRGGRAAELAWHFLEGDDPERALRYSLLAGDKAEEVFAHGEAARHYDTALGLARELGDGTHLRRALLKLGGVLNLLGRYDAAVKALEEAILLAREANDLSGEMEAVTHLMRLAPERGNQTEALRWIQPLLPRLEAFAVSPQKLAFLNAYAYFLVQTVQFDEGLRVAETAAGMADALGDGLGLARTRVNLGHLLLWHGRARQAQNLLEPVAPALEEAGDLPEAMRAASLLAQVAWFSGDVRAAATWRERSLRLARQAGNAAQAAYETCMLGYQHLRAGEMEMAWQVGRRALAEARELDQSTMTGAPLGLLATMSCMQGRWDDLERYAHDMVSLSDHSDEPWWRRHGTHTLALRDLVEGRPDRALARLEPLFEGTQLDIQEQALFLPAFAEAYLEAGNLPRAQQVLSAPLALPRLEMQGMLPDALRVHARVLLATGHLAGAEAVLRDLIDVTRSMPHPFAQAQALTVFGELEARQGRPGAVRERLEEAVAIYRRLGAQPFVAQIEQALAQLARGSAPEI